ncbi:MAG: hypothetical protein RQ750_18090, partial [Roseovarius sp.]|nr:hypothetical protein [Roseovarius sp.]
DGPPPKVPAIGTKSCPMSHKPRQTGVSERHSRLVGMSSTHAQNELARLTRSLDRDNRTARRGNLHAEMPARFAQKKVTDIEHRAP